MNVFVVLFLEIRAARLRWLDADPALRPQPHNVALHGPLAHAVDEFNAAVGGAWSDTYDELMAMAGRDDGDYDADDEDEEMGEEEEEDEPRGKGKEREEKEMLSPGERARQGRLLRALVTNQENRERAEDLAGRVEDQMDLEGVAGDDDAMDLD